MAVSLSKHATPFYRNGFTDSHTPVDPYSVLDEGLGKNSLDSLWLLFVFTSRGII